ncbi:MAG: hypothetical protein OEU51_05150 [Gammaproteobacteria bacterium]|nr:hypothetical protein [Gammaproteobacteria bacterium]
MGISSASIECAGYDARTTLRGTAGFVMERQTIAEFNHACAPGSGKFHE